MLKPKEIAEIALVLWYLPLEKVEDIKKLVLSMKRECGYDEPVDDSDEWTDEDKEDIQRESMRRLDEEDPYPWEEPSPPDSPPLAAEGGQGSAPGDSMQGGVNP